MNNPEHPFFGRRRFGVLLHPSSLPGGHFSGDLGPEARRFVDWLASAGASIWQVLPLCPPGGPLDDCPYASWAALAGNPQLISLDDLVDEGRLDAEDANLDRGPSGWAEPARAGVLKAERLRLAWSRSGPGHPFRSHVERLRDESPWALDAARFAARKSACKGLPWWEWPSDLRSRDAAELVRVDNDLEPSLSLHLLGFALFERQWSALRVYANQRGVEIMGDIPIYVGQDSVDVWAHPEGFRIDAEGQLEAKAGAPPDMFSADGQLWGSPLYDWAAMAEDDYAWWRRRLERALAHADAVRVDHFRAFAAHWEVPPEATTAREGRWVDGPSDHFFETIRKHLGPVALCAEDLGMIDEPVIQLLERQKLPGMRVLHYAFGENADNPHLPHNVPERAIVYPGNHDNDTSLGWWSKAGGHVRSHAQHYLGRHGDDIAWDLNRVALACRSRLAILQMQDVLGLPSEARMNDPASYWGPPETWRNWRWRFREGQASEDIARRLRFLAELYGRV